MDADVWANDAESRGPLFTHEADACVGCWSCVRHCPARALRIADGRVEPVEGRCVKCGTCVTECSSGAHSVRDDTPLVRSLLATGRPVVAMLASEHIAALHPRTAEEVERELLGMGFSGVETSILGEELVAVAYEQAHARADSHLPRLRSTCPVATGWVRRYHSQLTGALEPIVPPYVAQARLIRSLYPDDVAVVYVSPCWARKDEVFESSVAGAVDVAIGFDELRTLLDTAETIAVDVPVPHGIQPTKHLSATDGFPRRTLEASNLTSRDFSAVRGLLDLDRILTGIVRGEAAPHVVDMLSCEGCLDGPCVNRDLTVFAKRNIDAAERERQPVLAVDRRELLAALPHVNLVRRFEPLPVVGREPTDVEIDAVIAASEYAARIDGLTGLSDRRGFEARLAEEVARSTRYRHDLSLVVLALDGFEAIAAAFGPEAGDALLRAFGALLATELRASDIAARLHGDEFALILPGTGKTEAWAVAEKIRTGLRSMRVRIGERDTVTTTGSAGVASAGDSLCTPHALLDAASGALGEARRAGHDRVELAAG